MNDKALIARVIARGDQHAFATLVRQHQNGVRNFLRRLTAGDHAQADDLAQEVFLRAYKSLKSFRAEASFSSWLHSIAYRSFLNERRKSHHHNEVAGDALPFMPGPSSTVDSDIMVERLMRHLSVPERTCLTLSLSAGMSHQEIVAITDLPLGTVKSHIARGKQKLIDIVSAPQNKQEVAS
ncbi:RNA polymerase sigma factor [Idiomarina abyssalis]|uniref:RNA polymerase sigma factor n=1 Tax=Idiomarina abyssalis TaxID=86102 RepID=UPI0006C851D0|nr:sigma-70 family RNA polymerase sigma factor [Idiomarina abyssalis]KPD22359.1 hypothetical protein ADS78_01340 [Idiomarina abyssalis]SFT39213.1 RNA polymerase sigma-70 factor, ECF subfamily [Idiomarina abyssalis]